MYLDILSHRFQANQVLHQVPSTPIQQILSQSSLHSPISVSLDSSNAIITTRVLHTSPNTPLVLQGASTLYTSTMFTSWLTEPMQLDAQDRKEAPNKKEQYIYIYIYDPLRIPKTTIFQFGPKIISFW